MNLCMRGVRLKWDMILHVISKDSLSHIDPLGAVCMVLTGFCQGRPVQVNPL